MFFQQAANAGTWVGGLDEHQFRGLSRRPVVDGLEEAMQLPRQPHGRPPHLTPNRRQHHESATRLPAHR